VVTRALLATAAALMGLGGLFVVSALLALWCGGSVSP
jgi:hypothetical protein